MHTLHTTSPIHTRRRNPTGGRHPKCEALQKEKWLREDTLSIVPKQVIVQKQVGSINHPEGIQRRLPDCFRYRPTSTKPSLAPPPAYLQPRSRARLKQVQPFPYRYLLDHDDTGPSHRFTDG